MNAMNTFSRQLFTLCLLIPLISCAQQQNHSDKQENQQRTFTTQGQRILAIGDLHGDYEATQRALILAGAMNTQHQWTGGQMQLVQVGDQLDRGDGEREILDLLDQLAIQARQAGGKVHVLNGNHEIMNAQGDLRYVTPKGFDSFGKAQQTIVNPAIQKLPAFAQARAMAFAPGGEYALRLAKRPTVLNLDGNVFVHGGLLPTHVNYGVERINQTYQDWLSAKIPDLPAMLVNEQSPIWTRVYSNPQTPADCDALKQTLQKIGGKRMIVGHSVQAHINPDCQEGVWRIDVGMSRAYGGPIEVLEINGEKVRVLTESK